MSFETIRIHRDVPSIDGTLQVPPNLERQKNTGTPIDQTLNLSPPIGTIVRLTGGSGRQRGSKTGAQIFLRLYGITPNGWYDADPMDSLRTS